MDWPTIIKHFLRIMGILVLVGLFVMRIWSINLEEQNKEWIMNFAETPAGAWLKEGASDSKKSSVRLFRLSAVKNKEERKEYVVHLPNTKTIEIWNTGKYGRNEEKLFKKYPDADVWQVIKLEQSDFQFFDYDEEDHILICPKDHKWTIKEIGGITFTNIKDNFSTIYPDCEAFYIIADKSRR